MVRRPLSPRKPRRLSREGQAAESSRVLGEETLAEPRSSEDGASDVGPTAPTADLSGEYEAAGLDVAESSPASSTLDGEGVSESATSRPRTPRSTARRRRGRAAAGTQPLDVTGEQLRVFDTGSLPPVRDIRSAPSVASAQAAGEEEAYALSEESNRVSLRDDFSVRRAERQAERRRFLGLRLAQSLVAVLAVAGLAYALFFSPLFALRTANVHIEEPAEGAVPSEDILSALSSAEGTSLFRLRPAHLAELVEDGVPRVQDVAVSRALPHGLVLSYEKRAPIACLVDGSTCQPIDAQGREMDAAGAEEEASLARIEYAGDSARLGEAAQAVVDVLSVLPPDVAELVAKAQVSETSQIVLLLADGRIIDWGMPGDDEEKAAVLSVILSDPAVLYDVSEPKAPVTGPSPAA